MQSPDTNCTSVFHIDLTGNDAALQYRAILCWPFDPRARTDFLLAGAASARLAIGAALIQNAEQLLSERLSQLPPDTLPCVAEVLAAEYATELARKVHALRAAAEADITQRYFEPYGGLAGLLNAPTKADILRSAEAAGGKYGAACGELLSYIVMIDRHHRGDLEPSLRLARHIMEESSDRGRTRDIPADRDRREMWPTWRGIAPYWAALRLARMAAGPGRHDLSLPQLISAGHSLTNFAIGFRPARSHAYLLPADEVIRINPEQQPIEPLIPPLSPEELDMARTYKPI
jgi:hypothetical protein